MRAIIAVAGYGSCDKCGAGQANRCSPLIRRRALSEGVTGLSGSKPLRWMPRWPPNSRTPTWPGPSSVHSLIVEAETNVNYEKDQ